MAENFRFDYYYGSQADQFSFFRLPKVLIRDKRFKNVSSDAKILYGILLDRMSLSLKNKWLDDENRVYIIFTIAEIMEEFDCSERKAIELLGELDNKSGIGLIEKKRQGLGRPNLIYVKNFVACEETEEKKDTEKAEGEVLQFQNCRNVQVKNCESVQVKSGKSEKDKNCKNEQDKNCENVQVKNCKNEQVKNCENVQVKNCTEGKASYIDYNNTDSSETESIYPINHTEDGMDTIELYRKIVKENISYDYLRRDLSIMKQRMLDEIVELMVEVLAVNRKSLRIAGADYPYQLVKSRFMCIDQYHVEYVLNCLNQTSSKIGNIKGYILTSLFNATATIDTYYQAAVNNDMMEGI